MDVLLFYFEFVHFLSCWVFIAAQALLQRCQAEAPGAVLGGLLEVLPSRGVGPLRVLPSCGAGLLEVVPSCGRGFSGCYPLVGGASQGAALLWGGAPRGAALLWGGASRGASLSWGGASRGAALLWAGLLGVLPSRGVVLLEVLPSCRRGCQGAAFLRGGAVGGAGFSSFRRGLGRRDFRSLQRRLSSWDAQA